MVGLKYHMDALSVYPDVRGDNNKFENKVHDGCKSCYKPTTKNRGRGLPPHRYKASSCPEFLIAISCIRSGPLPNPGL